VGRKLDFGETRGTEREAEPCNCSMKNKEEGGLSGEMGGNRKWQPKQVIEDHGKELQQLGNFEVKQQNALIFLGFKIINLADWYRIFRKRMGEGRADRKLWKFSRQQRW
jgi:hypothetical protein